MQFVKEHTILIFVSILGLVLITQAASMALASMHYNVSRSALQHWSEGITDINDEDYYRAHKSALRSSELHPSLALYTDTLSEVIQWGAYSEIEVDSEKSYKSALNYNLHSVTKRPSWYASWINAAYIKWQLNELDSDFYLYLDRASDLGKNNPEVNLFYMEFGLYLIDTDLPTYFSRQHEIERRILLSLNNIYTRKSALSLIKKYNKVAVVCSWVDETLFPDYKRLCG